MNQYPSFIGNVTQSIKHSQNVDVTVVLQKKGFILHTITTQSNERSLSIIYAFIPLTIRLKGKLGH